MLHENGRGGLLAAATLRRTSATHHVRGHATGGELHAGRHHARRHPRRERHRHTAAAHHARRHHAGRHGQAAATGRAGVLHGGRGRQRATGTGLHQACGDAKQSELNKI